MDIYMKTVSEEVGTFGHMTLPNGHTIATVEQPWNDNAIGHSCIPAGTYKLLRRESGVVMRTTHGEFSVGWEVTGVTGRKWIMIHVANWPTDVEGCIGVGRRITEIAGRKAVDHSLDTFRDVMSALAGANEWTLHIERS